MLKNLVIDGFYDHKEPLELDFSEGLTILTGDNGAGKTTLLNVIFNILNGDFLTLSKSSFKKITLELDTQNDKITNENKSQIITTIEVERSKEGLFIKYFLDEVIYTI
ncbi:AAA family ATPase, partial [Bacillus cereus]